MHYFLDALEITSFQLRIRREARKKLKEEIDKLLVEIREVKTSAASLSRLEVSLSFELFLIPFPAYLSLCETLSNSKLHQLFAAYIA